jgi:hypothetical protein
MKVAEKLSKTLFWDVDIKKLDNEKSKHFIIGRVLDFGTLEDWKIIKDFYGITKILVSLAQLEDSLNYHNE